MFPVQSIIGSMEFYILLQFSTQINRLCFFLLYQTAEIRECFNPRQILLKLYLIRGLNFKSPAAIFSLKFQLITLYAKHTKAFYP